MENIKGKINNHMINQKEKRFSHWYRTEKIKCFNANIYWIAILPSIGINYTKYNEKDKENKFLVHIQVSFTWLVFSYKIHFEFISNENYSNK